MTCEQHIKDKMSLLERELIFIVENCYTFKENESIPDDCTVLNVKFVNPIIYVSHLEDSDKRNNYFVNKNRADALLFEHVGENLYRIHIIELKKKVKSKEWGTIKEQFVGSLLQAIMWANFFGMHYLLDDTVLYTCYRIDKISDAIESSPIERRLLTGESAKTTKPIDWLNDSINLCVLKQCCMKHCKVKLDSATGIANIVI